MHGSLTTKELKKHSSRLVGGVAMGSRVDREDLHGKVVDHRDLEAAGGLVGPTFTCS